MENKMALAEMIALHEYPFSIVDHYGFKNAMATIQPQFKLVFRKTIGRDVHALYELEEEKNMYVELGFLDSRLSFTSDLWTFSQSKGYCVIIAHYIDSNWMLKRRILSVFFI